MNVQVQYTGQLCSAIRQSQEQVDLLEGGDVSKLLRQLAERHPAAAFHLLGQQGQVAKGLLIVLNGTALSSDQAATVVLHNGDVVTFLEPIAGG